MAQTKAKMTAKLAESDAARDASERMIALGRLGEAHDVARAIEFLLHPDSCYITGACLRMRTLLSSTACPSCVKLARPRLCVQGRESQGDSPWR